MHVRAVVVDTFVWYKANKPITASDISPIALPPPAPPARVYTKIKDTATTSSSLFLWSIVCIIAASESSVDLPHTLLWDKRQNDDVPSPTRCGCLVEVLRCCCSYYFPSHLLFSCIIFIAAVLSGYPPLRNYEYTRTCVCAHVQWYAFSTCYCVHNLARSRSFIHLSQPHQAPPTITALADDDDTNICLF